MNYATWSIRTIVLILMGCIPFLLIASYNIYIDPFWLFSHQHENNDVQYPMDERLLKTNLITYGNEEYENIMVGTSRVTYMNQHELPKPTFNFSVSSMLVEEYEPYISFAQEKVGHEFSVIYVGLDFWQTNTHRPKVLAEKAKDYFHNVNTPLYRMKQVLRWNTYTYSKINHEASEQEEITFRGYRGYDRNNVAWGKDVDARAQQKYLNNLTKELKEEQYEYDPNYKKILQNLKRDFPNSKFVVFLTPVTNDRLLLEFKDETRRNGYERWLRDVTDVFGNVYSFMTPHPLNEKAYFYDTQHAKPHVGTEILGIISGDSSDYGIFLTPSAVEDHIREFNKTLVSN